MMICNYALVLWALITSSFIALAIFNAIFNAYEEIRNDQSTFDTYMQNLSEAFENEPVAYTEVEIEEPIGTPSIESVQVKSSPFLNMTLKQLKSRIKENDALAKEVNLELGKSYYKAKKGELQEVVRNLKFEKFFDK